MPGEHEKEKNTHKTNAELDANAKNVMIYTDLGKGPTLYYITANQLKEFPMTKTDAGYGEGVALVSRNVILSAVTSTDVPIGSFSTLVNIAALNTPKKAG
jgi:hypothetical protein